MALPEIHNELTHNVKARLSRGLADLSAEHMIRLHAMVETIRKVYEVYGFTPLSTPAIEYLDVLGDSSGEEARSSIFSVISREKENLGLRFDLTVPLARFVAQHYNELPRPFRRYQIAPVWRCDKPGKGRLREFLQFDIDSVGVPSELADTEIIAAMCDSLDALRVGPYKIRLSSRGILNVLIDYAGIPHTLATDVFRVLDKLDKNGREKVRLELTTGYKDESGAPIEGLRLTPSQVERVDAFLDIPSQDRNETLHHLRRLFKHTHGASDEIDELHKLSDHLAAIRYYSDRVAIDVSIARGLAYYTGPIFEAVVLQAEHVGAVMGGGRYDNLLMRFLGERVPAVGASIGVSRLLSVLDELHPREQRKSTARVLVANLDEALTPDYLQLTWELRRAGIPTELFLGSTHSMQKQLRHADRARIPIVALLGAHEKASDIVTIKDMDAGRANAVAAPEMQRHPEAIGVQQPVPRAHVVATIRHMLQEMDSHDA
ncbi:MAG TPA: histidine--tRNA ligase [Thermoanaerobaculia bacterium]|nr:histidine--tRNA ligase [Thermoanaerobaculia bacterium]